VDPFSTGALVAASVAKRGLKLVIVWSDAATRAEVDTMQHTLRDGSANDPTALAQQSSDSSGANLGTPVITHDASAASAAGAVAATVAAIQALGAIVLAVSARNRTL
jgi:hypothetical protein